MEANPARDRKNYPYHIKLNDVGYILAEAGGHSVYSKEESPFAVSRSTSGNPNYRDTRFWQYWVQEDWTEGLYQKLWQSSSRFYESLDVDTTEEFEVSLAKRPVTITAPTSGIKGYHMVGGTRLVVGSEASIKVDSFDGSTWRNEGSLPANRYSYCVVNGQVSANRYIWVGSGSKADTAAAAKIYEADLSAPSFTLKSDLSGLFSTVNYVQDICLYSGSSYALAGNHTVLAKSTDNGVTYTAFTDLQSMGYKDSGNGALAKYAGFLIIAGGTEGNGFLLATDGFTQPQEIADFRFTGIYDIEEWGGYLWIATTSAEVWFFNGAVVQPFFTFPKDWGITIQRMHGMDGELWIFTTATDATKAGVYILNQQGIRHYVRASASVTIYTAKEWNGVQYLGTSDASNGVYKMDKTKYQDTGYTISSFFDASLPSIPKLWHAITVQTEALPADTSVEVQWRALDTDSWTSLGTISDTGSEGETFKFANGTIEKQIQIKTILTQAHATDLSTPVVKKVIVQYDISPYLYNIWLMRVVSSDKIKLLNGFHDKTSGQELMENIWSARRDAKVVTYQDIDYAQTQLNGSIDNAVTTLTVDSTKGFPSKGRVKVEDEEIYYTGKTATTFTGCLRGATGTKAVSHADNKQVDNSYKVLIFHPKQIINTTETMEGELEFTLLQS